MGLDRIRIINQDKHGRKLVLKRCVSCGRFFYRNKWVCFDKKDFLRFIINNVRFVDETREGLKGCNVIKINDEDKRIIIKVRCKVRDDNNVLKNLKSSKNGKEWVLKEFLFNVKVEKTLCKDCSIKKSKRYDGILQIRGIKESGKFNMIDDLINKVVLGTNGFITKKKQVKDGVDYYITPIKSIRKAAFELHKRFGGIIELNEELVTRDSLKSRDVYRVNAIVRLPRFKVGSVIVKKSNKVNNVMNKLNRVVLITGLKNKIVGIDLRTGHRVFIDFKEEGDYEELMVFESEVVNVIRGKGKTRVEVLNPEDYTSEEPVNLNIFKSKSINGFSGKSDFIEKLRVGSRVKVVVFKDEIFLLPTTQ